MPTRRVRARQVPDGHFEFTEPVRLPTAPEFTVVIEETEEAPQQAPRAIGRHQFAAWNLGVQGVPTRAEIYEDLV